MLGSVIVFAQPSTVREVISHIEGTVFLDGQRLESSASRWPLMRGIVAESLRPVLEPEELDRVPLPSDEATLFELLCLVRVARCIAPPPSELRWMSADIGDNTINLDGIRVYYQQSLDREPGPARLNNRGTPAHVRWREQGRRRVGLLKRRCYSFTVHHDPKRAPDCILHHDTRLTPCFLNHYIQS